MKKMLLIPMAWVLIATQTIYSMEALKEISMQLYDSYFKTCDIGKTVLVATVGLLVFDRIYPIFPQRKPAPPAIIQPSQTYIENIARKKIDEGILNVLEDTINPALKVIGERLSELPNVFVTQEYFGKYVLSIEGQLNTLSKDQNRFDLYDISGSEEVKKILQAFRNELAEYQASADSIENYLTVLSLQQGSTRSSAYLDDDEPNDGVDLKIEDDEGHQVDPYSDAINLGLKSSASFKADGTNQYTPRDN